LSPLSRAYAPNHKSSSYDYKTIDNQFTESR